MRQQLVQRSSAPATHSLTHFPPGEQQQELGAVACGGEEGAIEQVLEQVVTPDVDHVGDLRTAGGDVGEVLIRADAYVGAASRAVFDERVHRAQITRLVGDEVVGVEVATRFGERGDRGGEVRVR